MTSRKQRRQLTPEFKAKVAIEALKERQTLSELAKRFSLHPNQISTWKKQLVDSGAEIFATGERSDQQQQQELIDELYRKIGQHQVELDFLKKKSGLLDRH